MTGTPIDWFSSAASFWRRAGNNSGAPSPRFASVSANLEPRCELPKPSRNISGSAGQRLAARVTASSTPVERRMRRVSPTRIPAVASLAQEDNGRSATFSEMPNMRLEGLPSSTNLGAVNRGKPRGARGAARCDESSSAVPGPLRLRCAGPCELMEIRRSGGLFLLRSSLFEMQSVTRTVMGPCANAALPHSHWEGR